MGGRLLTEKSNMIFAKSSHEKNRSDMYSRGPTHPDLFGYTLIWIKKSKTIIILSVLALLVFFLSWFAYKVLNPVLFLFLCLIIIISVYSFKNIQTGFYSFLVLVPFIDFSKRLAFIFDVSRFEYFLAKSLPDLIPLLMLLHYLNRPRRKIMHNQLDIFVAIFLFWIILETFNPRSMIIIGLGGFHVYAIPLLLFFHAKSALRSSQDLSRSVHLIVFTVAVSAIYGFYQAIFGLTDFEVKCLTSPIYTVDKLDSITYSGIVRIFSTFTSHKEFGFALAVSIMFLLLAPIRINPAVRIAGTLLLITALLLTLHRASMLALGAGLFIYFICKMRAKIVFTFSVFLALISPVLVPVLGVFIIQLKLQSGIPFLSALLRTGSFGGRIRGFQRAGELVHQLVDPIGHGVGSIRVGKRMLGTYQPLEVPHNGYLEMLWEIGIIGTLIFITIVIIYWYLVIKVMNSGISDKMRTYQCIASGVVFGILLTHGIINSFTQMYHTSVYFWVCMGIISLTADIVRKHRYSPYKAGE